jgi:hypothetical protein
MSGERAVLGKHVLLEARLGRGHVVLLGFRPQFRGQTTGSFRFLLNSIYLASAQTPMSQTFRIGVSHDFYSEARDRTEAVLREKFASRPTSNACPCPRTRTSSPPPRCWTSSTPSSPTYRA